MTGEDVAKAVVGTLLGGLIAAVTWLANTVLGNRERALVQAKEVEALQVRVATLEASQITTECVREVIEEALRKRDLQHDKRREEWDRLQRFEIAQAVRDEFERAVPKILRELRGETAGGARGAVGS